MSVLVAVGTLAAATAADSRIVPGEAIAGARLGMTPAEVGAKLGAPDSVRVRERSGHESRRYTYRRLRLYVDFFDAEAISVRTRNRRERTRGGLGVGSTLRAVRDGLRKERCNLERGTGWCSRTYKNRDAALSFTIRDSRVTAATVFSPVSIEV